MLDKEEEIGGMGRDTGRSRFEMVGFGSGGVGSGRER
jgi:hypothetical protein